MPAVAAVARMLSVLYGKYTFILCSLYCFFILITIIDKQHTLCSCYYILRHLVQSSKSDRICFCNTAALFTKFLCGYFCDVPSSYIKISKVSRLEAQTQTCVPLKFGHLKRNKILQMALYIVKYFDSSGIIIRHFIPNI